MWQLDGRLKFELKVRYRFRSLLLACFSFLMKLRNVISIEKERKIKPNYLTFCLFKLCTNVRFLIHFVTLEVVPTFGGTVTLQPNFFGLMLLVRTDGLTLGRTVTSKPNYF